MGMLGTTIMFTALVSIPLAITTAEWEKFVASHRGPSCRDVNAFGLNNMTGPDVEIGKWGCTVTSKFVAHCADPNRDPEVEHLLCERCYATSHPQSALHA